MSDLQRLVELGDLMVAQEKEVARLTKELAAAKKLHLKTSTEILPDLMSEIGVDEIKLSDGSRITCTAEVDCAITESTREGAMSWLINNGFGGLIKTTVTLEFGSGEREAANELAQELAAEYENSVTLKEVVHPQTLKSFVREQMAAGAAIPMDTFNVRPYNIVKLKKGK